MNKKACTFGENRPDQPVSAVGRGPVFPMTGSEVIRGLKASLERVECARGERLTQKRFAELIGMPSSTINDWYKGRLVNQIKAFICGLERLSEGQRISFLRQVSRDCFRLQDPRLAHDAQSVSALAELVREPAGLTFIAGGSDTARTFLVTAMGNSAGGEIRACGLDAHLPYTFVPVSGVFYLRKSCSAVELQTLLRGVWPLLANAEAQLLLLNGIWSRVPEIHAKITELSRRRNVLVADDFGNSVPRLRDWPEVKASLIQVQCGDGEEGPFRIRIQGHARKLISKAANA